MSANMKKVKSPCVEEGMVVEGDLLSRPHLESAPVASDQMDDRSEEESGHRVARQVPLSKHSGSSFKMAGNFEIGHFPFSVSSIIC